MTGEITGLILNTRPAEYRDRFNAAFAPLGPGWRIVHCPVLTPAAVPADIPAASDLIVFTSQIAVGFFPFTAAWAEKPVYAVGEATADAARARGFTRVVATGEDVENLAQALAKVPFAAAVYPSATDVSRDLARDFPGRLRRIVTYRMEPRAALCPEFLAAEREHPPVIAPVFSKRSAATLADLLDKAGIPRRRIDLVAISAEARVDGDWAGVVVAAQPTLASVAAAAKDLMERFSSGQSPEFTAQ